jgi:hypothetical protein
VAFLPQREPVLLNASERAMGGRFFGPGFPRPFGPDPQSSGVTCSRSFPMAQQRLGKFARARRSRADVRA